MTTLTRPSSPPASPGGEAGEASLLATARERLASPLAPYYLLVGCTVLLVGLGLVMVLSASSVSSYQDSGSSYTVFLDQLVYAGVGIALCVLGSRVPVRFWRRSAYLAVGLAIGLQALVFSPLGVAFQGNRNWVALGPFTLQPSELAKVALVVFGAAVLANKRRVLGRISHVLFPFVIPVAVTLVGLVVAGHDLGTGLIMLAIVGGMLFAAGVQARWFLLVGALAAAGAAYLTVASANRMTRIQTWVGGTCTDPHVAGCFQKVHAEYALADGGWWGVGLGASREKWSLLPEPHNDFILAIIGEELGLPGTFSVLLLFLVIGYASYRIVAGSTDWFVRVGAAGVMVWMISQAMLNIGSVIGMMPIIGVPLPLVSSGGSALIAALLGMGLLLAFARSLPGCQERLKARPSLLRRTAAVLPLPDRLGGRS